MIKVLLPLLVLFVVLMPVQGEAEGQEAEKKRKRGGG